MSSGDRARIWQSLSMYENTDLVRELYRRKHGGTMNATKAKEVASHFAQGHEYFESAAGAGELVRPLILFYGTMALSRGLVLFLDIRKSKLIAGHGLKEEDWADLNTQPKQLPNFKVTVDANGTFPDLCRVTENAEVCDIATQAFPKAVVKARYAATHPVIAGSETTVKEILSQIPDLSELYEQTFDEHPLCLYCDVTAEPGFGEDEDKGGGWVSVLETLKGVPDPIWVGQALGKPNVEKAKIYEASGLATTPEARARPGFHYFQEYAEDGATGLASGYDVVQSRSTGQYFLRIPTPGGLTASNIVVLYLIAFATGSLVRYHPGYWMSVIGRSGGAYLAPILSAAVSIVEEQFPRLVLERLR